ncbi:MAG TPA: class I SAM-dependent methyltransferase [Candidatus Dormibacteraeota bacterium]
MSSDTDRVDEEALNARVAERVASGEYPDTLDEDLEHHYDEILSGRRGTREASPLDALLARVDDASEFRPERIPYVSRVPLGTRLHKTVGQVVRRQTAGVLGQVDAYALAVRELLAALVEQLADERAVRESSAQLNARLDAVLDLVARRPQDGRAAEDAPWVPEPALAEFLYGPREAELEALASPARLLAEHPPVLVLGCGRGEMLELLQGLGAEARGVDPSPELVGLCQAAGLSAEVGAPADALAAHPEGLGAVYVADQARRLSPRTQADVVSLAARKLGPEGVLLVRDLHPESVLASEDPLARGPASPRLLTFLCKQAGFGEVTVTAAPPHYLLTAAR